MTGSAADLGFDIGADGTGYLNLVVGSSSGLYTANLTTGSVSLVGAFGGSFNRVTAFMTCFALLSILAMLIGRETKGNPLPR